MARHIVHNIHRLLTAELPLIISTPDAQRDVATRRILLPDSGGERKSLDVFAESIHEESGMSVVLCCRYRPNDHSVTPPKHRNYVIIAWAVEGKGHVETVAEQLEQLTSHADIGGATFLVIIVDCGLQLPQSLAFDITRLMWDTHGIMDVFIVVPDCWRGLRKAISDSTDSQSTLFNVYTWLPYDSAQCGSLREIVLLEQWGPQGQQNCHKDAQPLPPKIPKNLMGCRIKISTSHVIPYVISTDNITETHGNTIYVYRGVEIQYLLLIGEALNLTLVFLPPLDGDLVTVRLNNLLSLGDRSTEVVIGHLPMHPYLMGFGDATKTYIQTSLRWYVPCARPVPRMARVLSLFSPSIWLTIITVLILTALAFWITSSSALFHFMKEFSCYKTLCYCFYNVWAVFMGVSVTARPRSHSLRILFFIFVCYCLAMSTIFQAFFISFLVEPGYEKQIETFEELKESGASVALHPEVETIAAATGYDEYKKLKDSFTCEEYDECLARAITQNNFSIMAPQVHMEYIALTLGKRLIGNKRVCALDGNIVTGGFSIYFAKGHPLFKSFNILIQRCTEGGLVTSYWSQLNWNTSLRGAQNATEGSSSNSSMYFVFNMSHLGVPFCSLLLGYALSFTALLAELVFNTLKSKTKSKHFSIQCSPISKRVLPFEGSQASPICLPGKRNV
jgi:hypothetical protein